MVVQPLQAGRWISHKLIRLPLYGILLICLLTQPNPGQDQALKFERFSIEDGLAHTAIRQIVQDHQGFLWMITPNGINRYDGYRFQTYRHDPYDSTSLTANSQNVIHVGHSGTIWIGNFDGLCRYNPITDNFTRFQNQPDDSTSIWQNYANAIYEDRQGIVWIATTAVLNRLDPKTGTFTHYTYNPGNPYSILNTHISAIIEDPRPGSNALLLGSKGRGLMIFDKTNSRFTNLYGHPRRHPGYFDQYPHELLSLVSGIHGGNSYLAGHSEYADSAIWKYSFSLTEKTDLLISSSAEQQAGIAYDYGYLVGTGQAQPLWQFDPSSGRHMGGQPKNRLQVATLTLSAGHYSLHFKSDGSHSPAKWNTPPPKYHHLTGVHLSSISREEKQEIERLAKDRFRPQMLSDHHITTLFYDSLSRFSNPHVIWVGTAYNGVDRLTLPPLEASKLSGSPYYDIEHSKVERFPHQPGNINGPASSKINSIFVDHRGDVWIGTPRGLDMYSQANKRFSHYTHDPTNLSSPNSNNILHVMEDHSNNIWISTSSGVNKLNRHKHQFLHFAASQQPDRHQQQLQKSSISTFCEDRNGDLWIATNGGGLSRRDHKTGLFHHYPSNHGKPPLYTGANIGAIIQMPDDESGKIWLGTYGDGLIEFDPWQNSVRKHHHSDDDPQTLGSNVIPAMLIDRNNTLWIATDKNGFSKRNANGKGFTRYAARSMPPADTLDLTQHLRSPDIWALEDSRYNGRDYLWIGTVGGGLSRFDIAAETFHHFPMDVNYKQGTNSKTITDLHLDAAGILWIGTYSGGLNRYDPHTNSFQHYTVRDGLSNNMITAIEEDRNSNLWISTSSGLCLFDKTSRTFKPMMLMMDCKAINLTSEPH